MHLRVGFDLAVPIATQIDEAADLVGFAASLGVFHTLRVPHRWLADPPVLEPLLLLARLAPAAGPMRLMTSVMKPPIHNPVELAHQVATLDQICHGRFDFGVGLGWPLAEFAAIGAPRSERVARFEESLALMKLLWTGEQVSFEGRFWSVNGERMGYVPVQRPHPPLWVGALSVPASQRAARVADGLILSSQSTWKDAAIYAATYRAETDGLGRRRGSVGIERELSVAQDEGRANEAARARRVERAGQAYNPEERVGRGHEAAVERDPGSYSLVGRPSTCVETIQREREAIGFDLLSLSFANSPRELSARKDYLQLVAEEVLRPAGAGESPGLESAPKPAAR